MKRWAADRILNDPGLRRKAKEWCWSNGIDPNQVPVDGRVDLITFEMLEVEVMHHDRRGSRFLLVTPQSAIPEELLD